MTEIKVDELHKEIDLIQNCITRMANNSFLLKGWLVSIIAVIIALSPEDYNKMMVLFTVTMVTLSFWYLDAFFLRTEKMYRKMYTWVLEERKNGSRELQYDLNPHRFSSEVECIWKVIFSKTLRAFYGIVLVVIIIVFFFCYIDNILNLICICANK